MRSKIEKELKDIEGMPIDSNFKDIIKYNILDNCNDKLNIIDTEKSNGNICFVDDNGSIKIKIKIKKLSNADYDFFDKIGLYNVTGIVEQAYMV